MLVVTYYNLCGAEKSESNLEYVSANLDPLIMLRAFTSSASDTKRSEGFFDHHTAICAKVIEKADIHILDIRI